MCCRHCNRIFVRIWCAERPRTDRFPLYTAFRMRDHFFRRRPPKIYFPARQNCSREEPSLCRAKSPVHSNPSSPSAEVSITLRCNLAFFGIQISRFANGVPYRSAVLKQNFPHGFNHSSEVRCLRITNFLFCAILRPCSCML